MPAYLKSTGMVAGFALLVSTQASFAVDADVFAKNLIGYFEGAGYEISFSSATSSGDDVTIDGIEAVVPGLEGSFPVGSLTFMDVNEDGDGGYNIGSLKPLEVDHSFPESKDSPAVDLSIAGITAKNIHIPGGEAYSTPTSLMIAESSSTGAIAVSVDGNTVFSASDLQSTTRQSGDGTKLDFTASLDGMKLDFSSIPDMNGNARQVLSSMGYEQIEGDISAVGSWNLEDGTLELSEYLTDLSGVGRLNFSFSISGYTLKLVQDLQKMQQQMDSAGDDAKAQQAMGLAMMGFMQQLTFNSLSLRFDDDSVTDKVLGFVAAQQGMSIDQLVQGLKGMLPLYLTALQNPDFQQKVTTAVGAYLDDPGSLEISALPPSPLPFAMIAGAGMGAPQTLPGVLNVEVTANK